VNLVQTRRIFQGFFLLLFLWLSLVAWAAPRKGLETAGWPVALILDADPLLFLTTLFANRSLPPALWPALAVVAATAVLGRAFCGWVCPLGTFHDLAGGEIAPHGVNSHSHSARRL